MTDVPADDAPVPGQGEDEGKGTSGLLGESLSPVIAPEETDEERLSEPDAGAEDT